MHIKCISIIIILVILTVVNTRAELPYESDQEHSFVVTGGWQSYDAPIIDSANLFTINYIFQDKISLGVSHRTFTREAVYGTNNNLSGTIHRGTYTYINLDSYYNIYAQINLLNILQINSPVSISILGVYKLSSRNKTLVMAVNLYKKISLNVKHSIQPIFSIGYKEYSYSTSARKINIGGALIYSYSILQNINILVIPRVNYFSNDLNYTVQLGLSYGINL